MAKTEKKPLNPAPGEDVFREFAWNVAGAVSAAKTNAARRNATRPQTPRPVIAPRTAG